MTQQQIPKQSLSPKSNKRQDLIDATKALLWERGFESMSPKTILQQSGAGQGSLYHHFKGKRDLAAVALIEIDEEMRAAFDKNFNANLSALQQLSAYLDAPRKALKGCRFGRLANEQAITDPVLNPIISQLFTYFEDTLTKTVQAAQQDGELPQNLKPNEIATMLSAIVQGGYALSRIHQSTEPLQNAINGAKFVLRGLSKSA